MKKTNTNILFVLMTTALLLSGFDTYAQTAPTKVVIRGKVTDKGDNSAVIGASVIEIDKDNRTVTGVTADLEGNYALKITDPANRVAVSYMGYKTLTESINNRTVINFRLESDVKNLGEVIITGKSVNSGLTEIADRDRTSASVTVNAKDLEEIQATSIDQALQGRMAGVDIVANSGDPGAGMAIRIRGTSSLNSSSDPLIVVDGMPYETQIASDFNFATADEQGYAQLLNIAPSDIKEITVLKDAAATAIWGSRASNGVLVITTKRGIIGKPIVNYVFRGTIRKQPKGIPMLSGDQYSSLIPEAFMNVRGTPLPTSYKEFQYDPSDSYWYNNYSNNTNWIDEITQLGYEHDHNISLAGGGEKARYRTSVNYNSQQGTTIGTDLHRIAARINLDFNVSSRIRFQTDFAYTRVDNNRNYVNANGTADGIRNVAYEKMPNMSVYEVDEYGNQTPNFFSPAFNIQGRYSGTYNPVAMAKEARNNFLTNRLIPKFVINYQILPGILSYSFDVGFDFYNEKINKFLPQIATGRPTTETSVNNAENEDKDQSIVQTIHRVIYSPQLGEKHSLTAVGSFLTYDYKLSTYYARTANTASSELQDPSLPSRTQNQDLNLQSGVSQNRSVGALINVQYGFLDRYIFNVGVRRDGSSKFGENHRFGFFPSVGARWRISGEPFMRDFTFLNDLSLKASWGRSGNAPKNSYTFFNNYSNFGWNYLGMAGLYSRNMELRNLKWETVEQSNVGINVEILKKRVIANVDVYRRRTIDMFFPGLKIPSTSGFESVDMNVGTMDNQGWELSLNTVPIQRGDLKVRFDFNIARNFNVVRDLSEFYPRPTNSINGNGQYYYTVQENNPIGSFYGFRFTGVYKDGEATTALDKNGNVITDPNGNPIKMRFNYPVTDYEFQPGDAMYEDINHDGNINYMDVVYLGNSNPKFTGGFGPSLEYKGLKVSTYFTFRQDVDVINGTKMTTENMYSYENQSTAVLRRWRNPGDETNMPRALFNSGFNWLGSNRYVEDASFLRFKFVTVRYNFNSKVLKKFRARELSAYMTAENLYVWTKYTGQDPEVSLKGSVDPLKGGFDYSTTPPSKTITVGINVGF